jgi:hypothetical protein
MSGGMLSLTIVSKPGVLERLRISPKELARFMERAFPALVLLGGARPLE